MDRNATGGFTLIELVAAIALLGIVLVGLTGLERSVADQLRSGRQQTMRSLDEAQYAFLSRVLDQVTVVLAADSLGLEYLDQLGRWRQLNIERVFLADHGYPTTGDSGRYGSTAVQGQRVHVSLIPAESDGRFVGGAAHILRIQWKGRTEAPAYRLEKRITYRPEANSPR